MMDVVIANMWKTQISIDVKFILILFHFIFFLDVTWQSGYTKQLNPIT